MHRVQSVDNYDHFEISIMSENFFQISNLVLYFDIIIRLSSFLFV